MPDPTPDPTLPAGLALPTRGRASRALQLADGDTRPLKKAVDALAIVPAKDKIFPLARKLYNVLLYFAQRQGTDEQIYRAPLRELVRVVDFNSHNTEVIKNHLRQLVATKVEWQSPTTGEGARWSVSTLIAHCDLILRSGELFIEWSYAPNLKLQLLDPQRYARISLMYQAAMRSMASLVLYEICTRYVDNPGRVTARQPWQWWRPVLTGTPDSDADTYQEYKYFKRDVLKVAIAEVNAITDLEVSLIEHRQGRSVTDIQFGVLRKDQGALPMQHLLPMDLEAVGELLRHDIGQEQAEQMIVRYGEKAVMAALKTMVARKAQRGLPPIEQPAKFLQGILRNQAAQGQGGATAPAPAPSEKRPSRATLIEQYRRERRAQLETVFKEHDAAEQARLLERFRAQALPAQHAAVRRAFERMGLANPMARAEFYRWYALDTWGEGWDQPDDSELLKVVARD
jgi:hypothetical protein